MVRVARDEQVPADEVVVFDLLDHLHRKRQPRDPRRPRQLVGDVELRRRRVAHHGLDTEVVREASQQVRLLTAHQVDVAHLPSRAAGQRRRPHQARRAAAEEIDGGRARHAIDRREVTQLAARAPRVA